MDMDQKLNKAKTRSYRMKPCRIWDHVTGRKPGGYLNDLVLNLFKMGYL